METIGDYESELEDHEYGSDDGSDCDSTTVQSSADEVNLGLDALERLAPPKSASKRRRDEGTVDARGKRRRFPAAEDQRPALVYIEAPVTKEACDTYSTCISRFPRSPGVKFYDVFSDPAQVELPPHVSLTRTLTLRHAQIEGFVEGIRQCVADFPCFDLSLGGSNLLLNEDKSRCFIALSVDQGNEVILRMIEAIDNLLKRFDKLPFYQPPTPHVSVAWAVGDAPGLLLQRIDGTRAEAGEADAREERSGSGHPEGLASAATASSSGLRSHHHHHQQQLQQAAPTGGARQGAQVAVLSSESVCGSAGGGCLSADTAFVERGRNWRYDSDSATSLTDAASLCRTSPLTVSGGDCAVPPALLQGSAAAGCIGGTGSAAAGGRGGKAAAPGPGDSSLLSVAPGPLLLGSRGGDGENAAASPPILLPAEEPGSGAGLVWRVTEVCAIFGKRVVRLQLRC